MTEMTHYDTQDRFCTFATILPENTFAGQPGGALNIDPTRCRTVFRIYENLRLHGGGIFKSRSFPFPFRGRFLFRLMQLSRTWPETANTTYHIQILLGELCFCCDDFLTRGGLSSPGDLALRPDHASGFNYSDQN